MWCTVPEIQSETENFLSFWAIFCPFTPYGPRKSKFWKNKKKSEDNIILQMCTINVTINHMMYGSWDMECNGHNFFVTSDHFLPFYPLTTPKNHNFVKMKKYLKILSFYTCVPQMTIIWCMVPEIWIVIDRTFFSQTLDSYWDIGFWILGKFRAFF